MLDDFWASKAEEEDRFRKLQARALVQNALDVEAEQLALDELALEGLALEELDLHRGISVEDFLATFSEDWQKSQFW